MKAFFSPLVIFVWGNLALLLILLFFPAIGVIQTQLESDIAGSVSNFWGLAWVITSTRVLICVIAEGLILFAVGKAFLGMRR